MIKCGAFLLSISLGIAGIANEVPEDFEHECTSWFAFSNLTKNKTNILHKNRDSGKRNIIPIRNAEGSPRRWIGLGNKTSRKDEPCMGMNASGLAAIVNSGMINTEPSNPKGKMHTAEIIRDCLVNCDTAAQAVEVVERHRKSRQYDHGRHHNSGSIFMFMDTKEAYIVEMTAGRSVVTRYNRSYNFRANNWHSGDISETIDTKPRTWLHSAGREYMVIQDMNRALRANGKVTVLDMLAMARDAEKPKDFPDYFTLCNRTTNSASTLEISLAYPDVLSTGYFLIGPTRHTVCVPVPVCVEEEYLPSMLNQRWTQASWKRFDKLGFNGPVPSEFTAFEKKALAQYKAAQSEAEKLLAAGKRDEAVKLLNKTAKSIWLEAEKIVKPVSYNKPKAAKKK